MRDRDLIMYSKPFLRLTSKTQVVKFGTDDHARTRLTHTLEVAQIARTISKQLGLDEDLTEAIALGHDIGHTPFGHVGERILNMITNNCIKMGNLIEQIPNEWRGFKHNLQSVRVLVENSNDRKPTCFTLYGIREHSKTSYKPCFQARDYENACVNPTTSNTSCNNQGKLHLNYYDKYNEWCCIENDEKLYSAWSFEAYVVRWSDEVAQRHHDLEDAITTKLITCNDITGILFPLYHLCERTLNSKEIKNKWDKLKSVCRDRQADNNTVKSCLSRFLVDAYVTFLIEAFSSIFNVFCKKYSIDCKDKYSEAYLRIQSNEISDLLLNLKSKAYPDLDKKYAELVRVDKILQEKMSALILDSYDVQRMDGKASYVIRCLVKAYLTNPQQLPDSYIEQAFLEVRDVLKQQNNKKPYDQLLRKCRTTASLDLENIKRKQTYKYRKALTLSRESSQINSILRFALLRAICDHVGSMTDRYALEEFRNLY